MRAALVKRLAIASRRVSVVPASTTVMTFSGGVWSGKESACCDEYISNRSRLLFGAVN
jgi:hypothetical protein